MNITEKVRKFLFGRLFLFCNNATLEIKCIMLESLFFPLLNGATFIKKIKSNQIHTIKNSIYRWNTEKFLIKIQSQVTIKHAIRHNKVKMSAEWICGVNC